MSKLTQFIRTINRECSMLPLHARPKCVRLNQRMFDRLDSHALAGGIDITRATMGKKPPKGYDGVIADLPILIDNFVDDDAVQLDYEYDFFRMGI